MRFFVSSNIKENRMLYYMLLLFLLFSVLYWVSSWLFFYTKYGFSHESLLRYYFQDPESPERISLAQLSEDMHVHTFLDSMFLLVLSSLFLQTNFPETFKKVLNATAFLTAILYHAWDMVIYFLGPHWVLPKLVLFVLLQLTVALLIILNFLFLFSNSKGEKVGISTIRLILVLFSLLSLLFIASSFMAFFSKMGFDLQGIKDYYLGNPERYMKPKTWEGMWKVFHPHLLSMPLYLLTVGHLALFSDRKKYINLMTALSFVFAFLDNASGIAIRYLSPHFSYVKLTAFFGLQATLLFFIYLLLRD